MYWYSAAESLENFSRYDLDGLDFQDKAGQYHHFRTAYYPCRSWGWSCGASRKFTISYASVSAWCWESVVRDLQTA